jgi:hypothetical protein
MSGKVRLKGDDNSPVQDVVGSRDQMVTLIDEVLSAEGKDFRLHEIPAEKLVKISHGKADYRFFHEVGRFPIRGVVGTLTQNHFRSMVAATALSAIKNAQMYQPGGIWRVVAASVTTGHQLYWSRESTGVAPGSVANTNASVNPTSGESSRNKQATKPVQVKDPILQLEIVLTDISQSPPTDQNFERTGRRNGRHYQYAESGGLMKHLPDTLRKQRALALRVIRDYYELADDFEVVEISRDDKEKMQRLHEAGATQSELAILFSVSDEVVRQNLVGEDVKKEKAVKAAPEQKPAQA